MIKDERQNGGDKGAAPRKRQKPNGIRSSMKLLARSVQQGLLAQDEVPSVLEYIKRVMADPESSPRDLAATAKALDAIIGRGMDVALTEAKAAGGSMEQGIQVSMDRPARWE